MKTPITKESLLKFGMTLTEDPVIPMSKIITEGDEEVSIAVTRYFNCDQLALVINGVGQLLLDVKSIEDLEAIERLAPKFDSFI